MISVFFYKKNLNKYVNNIFLIKADCDIRDYGKKVQQLEIGFDDTNDKLTKAVESLEEKGKAFGEVESDVAALTRFVITSNHLKSTK